ncbi:hypothetical protein LCGC14_0251160 [marine sediment metagenome]|uniref:Uncharacterized protein n=1 Tax=marine sediment metagenome TaxID=412755 RepID=A0A0F9U8W5_9ZZZZ
MSKTRQVLRVNAQHLVRDEARDGTMFLVVPVVMLQEQILFCSNCHPDGEFISATEITSSLVGWNNRPVTLSHPAAEWSPANHQRLEVGRVFNAFWDGKLKAEMWLDLKALRRTSEGKAVEAGFRDHKLQEVSTGYFVDRIARAGRFRGQTFAIVQMNIVPDHLAVLTNEVGACSIEGGCGAPRLNSNGGDPMDDETTFIERLVGGAKALLALGSAVGDGSDDGDKKSHGPGNDGDKGKEASMKRKELVALLLKTEKVSFSEKELGKMKDEQLKSLATLAGCDCGDDDAAEAKRKVEAEAKKKVEAEAKEEEASMKRKELVAWLLKAENVVFSEEELGKMKDEQLKSLVKLAGDDAGSFNPEDQKFLTALRAAGGDSVDGLVALMEAGKVEAARRQALHDDLVKQLNKDEIVAMSKAVLNGMSLEALEGLDRSLNPTNYAGRGGARIENRGGDEEHFAPDAPAILLAEPDGTKSGDGDDEGGDS